MRVLIDVMTAIDPTFDTRIARANASKSEVGIVAVQAEGGHLEGGRIGRVSRGIRLTRRSSSIR